MKEDDDTGLYEWAMGLVYTAGVILTGVVAISFIAGLVVGFLV